MKQIDFPNAFPNGKLDHSVYVQLPKQLFAIEKRSAVVVMLLCSYYGLEDASKLWLEVMKDKFGAAGMKEMHNAPFIFQGSGIIALCCIDDLLVISKTKQKIDQLEIK